MSKKTSKATISAEVWRHLFDFIIATRAHREVVLEKHGLTPNDSRALFTIGDEGKTMKSLAEAWSCDASNATWMVDRLEKLNLAERRAVPGDRRVKLVVLTQRDQHPVRADQGALLAAAGVARAGSRGARESARSGDEAAVALSRSLALTKLQHPTTRSRPRTTAW